MLTVDVERAGDVAIVRCAGRIVRGAEVSILRNAVISEKNTRTIVLDLSELEFVDAGGLSVFVFLHNWTQDRGINLKLVHPSSFVRELLVRTGLDHIFEISNFNEALLVLRSQQMPSHNQPRQAAAY
jgi:anti-anti-sigma factor